MIFVSQHGSLNADLAGHRRLFKDFSRCKIFVFHKRSSPGLSPQWKIPFKVYVSVTKYLTKLLDLT